MSWARLIGQLAARSIRRPRIVPALVRVAWRFRNRRWYARFPFLPLPDRTYTRLRLYTAYGNYDAVPPAGDVERYSMWAIAEE